MGRLFKKSRNGAKRGPWIARYRDGGGIVRERSTGCRDKSAARAVLSDWESQAERQRAGLVSAMEADAADWAAVSISEHVTDWVTSLEGKGRTPGHCASTHRMISRITQECRFVRLADLSRPRLEKWLAALHETGAGARTLNAYATAAVSFGNWLVRDGRLPLNPFAGIEKRNIKADRRYERRALTETELAKLLDAARRRPLHDRMHKNRGEGAAGLKPATRRKLEMLGHERALIYRTLALTGLRRGELASITVGNTHLDTDRPAFTLEARHEKNRQGAQIPLRGDLAADIGGMACLAPERRTAGRYGSETTDSGAAAPRCAGIRCAGRLGQGAQSGLGLCGHTEVR